MVRTKEFYQACLKSDFEALKADLYDIMQDASNYDLKQYLELLKGVKADINDEIRIVEKDLEIDN